MNVNLAHRDFYHFFLIDLFVITRMIAKMRTCYPYRFAFFCISIDAIKSELLTFIFQSDIENLNPYQTVTLLSQTKRLNQLTLTLLATTVYLSYLSNPTLSHHLSSISLPKCMKSEGCFIFFYKRLEKE